MLYKCLPKRNSTKIPQSHLQENGNSLQSMCTEVRIDSIIKKHTVYLHCTSPIAIPTWQVKSFVSLAHTLRWGGFLLKKYKHRQCLTLDLDTINHFLVPVKIGHLWQKNSQHHRVLVIMSKADSKEIVNQPDEKCRPSLSCERSQDWRRMFLGPIQNSSKLRSCWAFIMGYKFHFGAGDKIGEYWSLILSTSVEPIPAQGPRLPPEKPCRGHMPVGQD